MDENKWRRRMTKMKINSKIKQRESINKWRARRTAHARTARHSHLRAARAPARAAPRAFICARRKWRRRQSAGMAANGGVMGERKNNQRSGEIEKRHGINRNVGVAKMKKRKRRSGIKMA
jgi:hypothetical protein